MQDRVVVHTRSQRRWGYGVLSTGSKPSLKEIKDTSFSEKGKIRRWKNCKDSLDNA